MGLAAAILHDPQLLVLDEPTNGLDPGQITETRELVRELGRTRTTLVSSHILAEVERAVDRVVIIAGGRVVADGDPEALRESLGRVITAEAPAGSEAWAAACAAECGASVESKPIDAAWSRHRFEPAGPASELHAAWGPGVQERIARSAAKRAVLLRELRAERPSLERAFLDLVEHADAPAAPGEPPADGPRPEAR